MCTIDFLISDIGHSITVLQVTWLYRHRRAFVAENAEDALGVDHLPDDADRPHWLDISQVAVDSCEEPETGIPNQSTLDVDIGAE